MEQLPLPKSGKINKIIQISDIHIRSGDERISRFHEYKIVFENLFAHISSIEEILDETAVIVITGDTFHHKCKIESPGILLFNTLISRLSNLAPTYIILGNHDFKQDQSISIDFLEAFLKKEFNSLNKVVYLKETGLYQAGNIGFGVVSVKDSLNLGSGSGIVDDLIEFPEPNFSSEVITKVALFHGTLCLSKFNNSRDARTGFAWDWIDIGYDFALLGDIHKYQTFKKDSGMIAAYSGSLLQQNFGEDLRGHGIIEWNLYKVDKIKFIEIANEFGYMKLNFCNDEWYYENNKIESILYWKFFPKNVRIRLIGRYKQENRNVLEDLLQNKKINYLIEEDCIINVKNSKETSTLDIVSYESINDYMISNKVDSYRGPSINMFDLNIDNLGNELNNLILKKEAEFKKEYEKYEQFIESFRSNVAFKLEYIEWSGLLCYNSKNWFDFKKNYQRINLLSGKNGSGKTSFLEVINIGLFGKSIPSRKAKSQLNSIITKNKSKSEVSYVEIHFFYSNDNFVIRRVFDNDGKPKQKGSGLFKMIDKKFVKEFSDISRLNVWIANNLGDQDTFLMTNMLTQYNDNDVLLMSQKEQREHLEKMVGLTKISKEVNLYKTKCNQYKFILGIMKSSFETLKEEFTEKYNFSKEDNDEKVLFLRKEIENLKNKLNSIEIQMNEIEIENKLVLESQKSTITLKTEIDELQINFDPNNILRNEDYELYKETHLRNKIVLSGETFNNIDKGLSDFLDIGKLRVDSCQIIEIPKRTKEECLLDIKEYEIWMSKNNCLKESLKSIENSKIYERELSKLLLDRKTLFPPCHEHFYNDTNILQIMKEINSNEKKLSEIESSFSNKNQQIVKCPFEGKDTLHKILNTFNDEITKNTPDITFKECDDLNDEVLKLQHELERNKVHENDCLEDVKILEERQLDLFDLKSIISLKLKTIRTIFDNLFENEFVSKKYIFDSLDFIESVNNTISDNRNSRDELKIKIDKYQEISDELEKIYDKKKTIIISTEEIKEITKNLPFNPKCFACTKQPLRVQLMKLKSTKNELNESILLKEDELSDVFKGSSYNDICLNFEKLNDVVVRYDELVLHKDKLYELRDNLKLIDQLSDQFDAIDAILLCIQNEISKINIRFKDLNQYSDKIKDDIGKHKTKIGKYNFYLKNYSFWKERVDYAKKNIDLWYSYDEYCKYLKNVKEMNDIKEEIIILKDHALNYENYEKYDKRRNEVEESIANLTSKVEFANKKKLELDICNANLAIYSVKRKESSDMLNQWDIYETSVKNKKILEYYDLKCEYDKTNEIVSKHEESSKKMKLISDLNKIIENRKNKIIKEKMREELKKVKSDLINKEVEKQVLDKLILIYQEKNLKYQKFSINIDNIQLVIDNIEEKIIILDKYRSNTIQNVIPILETYTNNLISSVDKNLKIKCSLEHDYLFKFSALTGNSEIPIEKTSGFERSIISICLRLAFIFLSLKEDQTYVGQLFIDEAFVNCDKEHLSHVPDFLSHLLRNFDSILLVSHLDIIKDTVDETIEIFEHVIRYGDEYI